MANSASDEAWVARNGATEAERLTTRFRRMVLLTSVLSLHLHIHGEHDPLIIQRGEREPELIGILKASGHATSLGAAIGYARADLDVVAHGDVILDGAVGS